MYFLSFILDIESTESIQLSHDIVDYRLSADNYKSFKELPDNCIYLIICCLLQYLPSIIIIESAHYSDELSWKEMHHIQR